MSDLFGGAVHFLGNAHVIMTESGASSLVVNALHFALAALGAVAIVVAARTQRFERSFWPLVFGLSGAIGLFALLISSPEIWFSDFKLAYWQAGEAIWRGHDALLAVFERGVNGFVNLPIIAYLFAPFGLLPATPAALVFSLLGAAAVFVSWRLMTRMFALNRRDSALLLFGLCAFGPLIYSVRHANSTHHLLLFLLLGLLAVRGGREILGGALFGFAAVMKPPLLIVGVLYALRGKWKIVAGGLGVCAGFALVSLAVFGWEMHRAWYDMVIAPYAGQPLSAFNAQSIASFVTRFETGVPGYIDWDPVTLSSIGKGAIYAISALLLGLCVAACWRRPTAAQVELEVFIAVTLVCLVSTLSWSHYFAWLAPAFAVLLQRRDELGVWRWAVLASFVLAAPIEFISPWMRNGAYGPFSNLLTSHLTIAGVIVLLALLRLRYGALKSAGSARS